MSTAKTILVIDDSIDDRMHYRRAIQKSSAAHTVIEAENGEEGLALIEREEPDCVLLDYSLPGHNGIEVLKRIRARSPFTPVVVLTGQGSEAVAVSAILEGAQNYISKSSITPEALQRVIRIAIDHCALRKRIHEQRNSLEVFTRALAHDLKEPVRTIRSFAELIRQKERFSDAKTQGYFQHIQNAADRMHMLIDMVYLYTRLEDPLQMEQESCDMEVVLKEAKDNLAQLIHERHAGITGGPLPAIQGNRTQMIQLLQNLIGNAIHHGSERPVIHIEAEEKPAQWLFKVRDNGPGIEGAYLDKIFDPFKRLTRQEHNGSGLGLAICRKIVESHGGKIWCESTPPDGAVFSFTLPKTAMREAPAANAPLPDMLVSDILPFKPHTALANVLLVDDSEADIEITRFRLLEAGKLHCNLSIARNGREALSTLRAHPADLVLLDINMPEMDGFELLDAMKKDETLRHMTVIMCTGSIHDKDMERARRLGAVGYITKPVEFNRLKSVIELATGFRLHEDDRGFALLRAA